MVTQSARLAMVTAFLWFGSGVGSAGPMDPIDLKTPPGLSAGAPFRFVYVTQGSVDATNSSIGYYNNFVNSQAMGATYLGNPIKTWYAIASTEDVPADVNINPPGVPNTTPVYRVDGLSVATSESANYGGLWSESILHPIEVKIDGTNYTNHPVNVWTGTLQDGSRDKKSPFSSAIGFYQYVLGEKEYRTFGPPPLVSHCGPRLCLLRSEQLSEHVLGPGEKTRNQPTRGQPSIRHLAGTPRPPKIITCSRALITVDVGNCAQCRPSLRLVPPPRSAAAGQ